MTYGRARYAVQVHNLPGAAVSHLAELVRGEFLVRKAPSSGPSGHLLPKGRRGAAPRLGAPLRLRSKREPAPSDPLDVSAILCRKGAGLWCYCANCLGTHRHG